MSDVHTMISPSLGGSGEPYLIAQVRILDGKFHMQILAPNEDSKNRPYGYAFDFATTDVVKSTILKLIKEAVK